MARNVGHISHCYGCGICAVSCSRNIINIHLDNRGFYAPRITDNSKCTDCGLCLKNCAFIHEELAVSNDVLSWGAVWSKDATTRKTCSSGGAGYELAKEAIKQGYEFVGVRYNTNLHRAEHTICRTIKELEETKGSKYLPSYTTTAFAKFEKEKKYFVCGSPCQIDSLRRWVKLRGIEDNFIFMDFFCHGVPSYYMWRKFVRTNFHQKKVESITFRSKYNFQTNELCPWHNSYVVTFKSHDIREGVFQPSLSGHKNWFYYYFLNNLCLGEQCYSKCKYKMLQSSADIRIGDAWTSAYCNNEEGVSAVLAFTKVGSRLLRSTTNLHFEQIDLELLCEGQMKSAPKFPPYYKLRLWLMKTPLKFGHIETILNKWNAIIHIKSRINGLIRRNTHNA